MKKYFAIVAKASIFFNGYLAAEHTAVEETVAGRGFIRAMRFSPSDELKFPGLNQNVSESSSQDRIGKGDEADMDSEGSDSDDGIPMSRNKPKTNKSKEPKIQ
ncbi:hypothetical protein TruAng_003342 [Truncatella angustata]|nr:hypothetical protein TruAng_003342 [Truncatella angustata]